MLCFDRYIDIGDGAIYESTRLDVTAWPSSSSNSLPPHP
jgi:hypothetical protein